MNTIPMSAPDINQDDVRAVTEVLRSGRLALGPRAEEFEGMVAEYCGVPHAIAVSSGTAGLHLLVKALDLGPGDEVLVPSFTFVASVNAILFAGAAPVFVDVTVDTYNLDPEDLERKITPRSRAIMVVDVFGHPAEWDRIQQVADRHGLKVIDDSCEALGAEFRGRKLGSFGDGAVFAFYPNKQITTGEGGMVVTGDPEIATRVRELRNQGRPQMGAWLEHHRLGFNYRLDEMSAALGCSQFKRIEELLEKRQAVARAYDDGLKNLGRLRTQAVKPYVRMSWFVYVVTLEEGLGRDRFMKHLATQGVPTRAYFNPVHEQPYIRRRSGAAGKNLPVTESIAKRTVALPFHGNLAADEIVQVVEACVAASRILES